MASSEPAGRGYVIIDQSIGEAPAMEVERWLRLCYTYLISIRQKERLDN